MALAGAWVAMTLRLENLEDPMFRSLPRHLLGLGLPLAIVALACAPSAGQPAPAGKPAAGASCAAAPAAGARGPAAAGSAAAARATGASGAAPAASASGGGAPALNGEYKIGALNPMTGPMAA